MAKTKENIEVPKHLADAGITPELWEILLKEDPATAAFFAAAPWQNSSNYVSNATTVNVLVDTTAVDSSNPMAKPSDVSWRNLQTLYENKCKSSPPLNRAINLQSDLVAGAGFSVYSPVKEINEYIKLIFNHHRNKLYQRVNGWMNRIQTRELFILFAFDETGFPFIRVVEPQNIGQGNEKGIITDPDDVITTLFYEHYLGSEKEIIPDAWCVIDPDGFREAFKRLQKTDKRIDERYIRDITRGRGKFNNIGGYRRFIYHWKNLSGIPEYLRDVPSGTTSLEWIEMVEQRQRWISDYIKSLSAYAYLFEWDDSQSGKMGAMLWAKMTPEEKAKHPLMQPMRPGDRLILPQGMRGKVLNPQFSSLSNVNQDLLVYASAGLGIPPDIFTGNLSGSTYASIKSTRPIFVIEIENLQHKFMLFLKDILRVCFHAKIKMEPSFVSLGGEKMKLLPAYDEEWDVEIGEDKKPTGKIEYVKVETVEKVKFNFPDVKVTNEPQQIANAIFGSKHTGLLGAGVSIERVLKEFFGIDDYEMEHRKNLIHQAKYGKPISGAEAERAIERQFVEEGAEGGGSE